LSAIRLPARITARARWARSIATYCTSRLGLREVVPSVTISPRSSATCMTPAAMAEKYGSAMSWTTSPTVELVPRATAWACRLGV
jgi:hypothetical protein